MLVTFFSAALILLAASPVIYAEQPMYVSLCNNADLDDKVLTAAKHEVEWTFKAAGASVTWVPCRDFDGPSSKLRNQLFVVRLQANAARFTANSEPLDTMGRAYTRERGSGYLADAYVPSIQRFRDKQNILFTTLLGLVISHELGHLVLGPGHTVDGIMLGQWDRTQTEAGRKHLLRFNHRQNLIIASEIDRRG